MKYSQKFTLEVKLKDFYKMAIPRVDKTTLKKEIKDELQSCLYGMMNGEWGGNSIDWLTVFYFNLHQRGIIKQTQESIDSYGEF